MTVSPINSIFSRDPTRTGSVRRVFLRELKRRFRNMRSDLRRMIVEGDALGLSVRSFLRGSVQERAENFLEGLEELEASHVFALARRRGLSGEWFDEHVLRAYEVGVRRVRSRLRQLTPEQAIAAALFIPLSPVHSERVRALQGRTGEELRGILGATNQEVSRRVYESYTTTDEAYLAEGTFDSRVAAARRIDEAVRRIGVGRGILLAEATVIRAHADGALTEMELSNVTQVNLIAEVRTAGGNVCPICLDIAAGNPYPIAEARNLIPAHPGCRCDLRPVEA